MLKHLSYTAVTVNYLSISHSNGQCATGRLLDFIGNVHDIESFYGGASGLELSQLLFSTHWGHLSIVFLWLSGTLFHVGWTGNYSYWKVNPISTIAISHVIWDPHFSVVAITLNTEYLFNSTPSYSRVYNWLLAVGFLNETQVYLFVLTCEFVALTCLLLAKLHLLSSRSLVKWLINNRSTYSYLRYTLILPIRFSSSYIDSIGLRLNFHISSLFGISSSLWAGHLVHASLITSRGLETTQLLFNMRVPFHVGLLSPLSSGYWYTYMTYSDFQSHVFGFIEGTGTSLLTFIGGINLSSSSLYLSDIAHHHLALGTLLIWAGHLYTSLNRGLGHRVTDVVNSSGLSFMSQYIIRSLHLQLSLALIGLSIVTSFASQTIYSLPSYPYISYDYISTVFLFVHHNWIASLLMVGSFSHSTLFLVRDYSQSKPKNRDLITRLLSHKASIISHLSWVSLFLGFHVLGIYVHNDAVVAFGEPYKQLLLEPFIAQSFMSTFSFASKSYGAFGNNLFDITYISLVYLSDVLSSSVGPGDFMAFHAIALGLHVTSLILVKGAFDSQGTSLMPDKVQLGFGFACDGPARGGTCDVSAWDAFYLSLFWALNSNSWLMFYFHWKHLLVWQVMGLKFEESSTFLNGWFRDYLWFNSASLIRGYDAAGSNDISVWAWTFLAAHLCWATGFMFLISWRGYWQELIDTVVYMHLKTPFLYSLWDGSSFSPVALSIVQARFIGLVHFSSGFIMTYAAFVLGATS